MKRIINKKRDYIINEIYRFNNKGKLTHVYDMFGHKWPIQDALKFKLLTAVAV